MLSAYAAGKDSSSTSAVDTMLAVSEFSSGGHGLAPPVKNSRYPAMVSGANTSGGLVAASASLWNEVSTIQTTGSTNRMPTTQASSDHQAPARSLRLGTAAPDPAAGRPASYASSLTRAAPTVFSSLRSGPGAAAPTRSLIGPGPL